LVWGYRSTVGRAIVPAHEAAPDRGFWKVLYHKYYIDEIYDAIIVRPLMAISRVILWRKVDQGLIDGAAVNGSAGLMRALGWVGGRLQTGQVGVYVAVFVVGALYVLGRLVW
jgi:NADH-quinone oxidoreductase subunit L